MGCFTGLLGEDRLVHIMPLPCTDLGRNNHVTTLPRYALVAVNWEAIMDEICRSNIMQRDNKKFAKKLDKNLAKLAKEKNKTVSKFSMQYCVDSIVLLVTVKKHFVLWIKDYFDKRGFCVLLRDDFKKNCKKDDIMHISNYPLPPCLIVTNERVTNHSNQ